MKIYSWCKTTGRADGKAAIIYEGQSQYDAMKAAEKNAAETGEWAIVEQSFEGKTRTWYILADGSRVRSFEEVLEHLLKKAV